MGLVQIFGFYDQSFYNALLPAVAAKDFSEQVAGTG